MEAKTPATAVITTPETPNIAPSLFLSSIYKPFLVPKAEANR